MMSSNAKENYPTFEEVFKRYKANKKVMSKHIRLSENILKTLPSKDGKRRRKQIDKLKASNEVFASACFEALRIKELLKNF